MAKKRRFLEAPSPPPGISRNTWHTTRHAQNKGIACQKKTMKNHVTVCSGQLHNRFRALCQMPPIRGDSSTFFRMPRCNQWLLPVGLRSTRREIRKQTRHSIPHSPSPFMYGAGGPRNREDLRPKQPTGITCVNPSCSSKQCRWSATPNGYVGGAKSPFFRKFTKGWFGGTMNTSFFVKKISGMCIDPKLNFMLHGIPSKTASPL